VNTKRFYSVREACAELNIGRSTIYKLAREGRIEIKKIGAKSVVPESSLAAFAESLPTLGRAA
jgi:excisionase family DNA binding protein